MKDLLMTFLRANWKTTAAALTTAVVGLLVHFGLDVDAETRDSLGKIVELIGIVAIGLFARDAKKPVTPDAPKEG